ncbi:MAG: hypothetical protein ACFFHD_15730 [Promethearchaeota archaeon]
MKKFQKYEKKLSKYIQKVSKLRFKEKLKQLVFKIGIDHATDFKLIKETPSQKIFPCHAGVLYIGDFSNNLFDKIKLHLAQIFNSFFYSIRNLGKYTFSKGLFFKGVKKEFKEKRKKTKKLNLHPTNKFYKILIEKKKEENIDMICVITELPIFSSKDDKIIFLFGEAQLQHQCCIVSTLTLNETFYERVEDQNLLEQRIIKEFIHEIGHLILGSEHCQNKSCVMRFSKVVEEIDQKSYLLCENCRNKLHDIKERFNF